MQSRYLANKGDSMLLEPLLPPNSLPSTPSLPVGPDSSALHCSKRLQPPCHHIGAPGG